MENSKTINSNKIIKKRDLLTQASIILKKEFFGMDSVIDQIIESISSWYFFPHMQERPVVLNLWGMTGVGKSDLLKRLVQLLKFFLQQQILQKLYARCMKKNRSQFIILKAAWCLWAHLGSNQGPPDYESGALTS